MDESALAMWVEDLDEAELSELMDQTCYAAVCRPDGSLCCTKEELLHALGPTRRGSATFCDELLGLATNIAVLVSKSSDPVQEVVEKGGMLYSNHSSTSVISPDFQRLHGLSDARSEEASSCIVYTLAFLCDRMLDYGYELTFSHYVEFVRRAKSLKR